jgi:hypothetical protein
MTFELRGFCSCESIKFHQDSTEFNKLWHLVRDQEAGGSNPLAPTILFNSLSRPLGFFITRPEAILMRSDPLD